MAFLIDLEGFMLLVSFSEISGLAEVRFLCDFFFSIATLAIVFYLATEFDEDLFEFLDDLFCAAPSISFSNFFKRSCLLEDTTLEFFLDNSLVITSLRLNSGSNYFLSAPPLS